MFFRFFKDRIKNRKVDDIINLPINRLYRVSSVNLIFAKNSFRYLVYHILLIFLHGIVYNIIICSYHNNFDITATLIG